MNNLIRSRTRATLSAASLLAVSLLLGGADAASSFATCDHGWHLKRAPGNVPLHDVLAAGPNRAWVVGEGGYAAHLAGGGWTVDRLPKGVQLHRLAGVGAFRWGIGSSASGRAVAMRWVKGHWRTAHVFAHTLDDPTIAVNGNHEVWLTGAVFHPAGYSSALISLRDHHWRQHQLPDGGTAYSVDTVSRRSTVAVGTVGRSGLEPRNYSWRWNGRSWASGKRIFTDTEDLDWTIPWKVALARTGKAFVASMFDEGDCCHISFYPSHLIRGVWHTDPYRFGTPFDIVTTASGDSATIVGDDYHGDSGGGSYYGVIYQWNGTGWVEQELPGLVGPSNYYGLDADSTGALWLVGADSSRGPVLARQCSPL